MSKKNNKEKEIKFKENYRFGDFNAGTSYALPNDQIYWLYKPMGKNDKSALNQFNLARFSYFTAKSLYIYGTVGRINLDSSGRILYFLP